jgi:hypothetical protein
MEEIKIGKKDKKLAERIIKGCIFAARLRENELRQETGSSLKEWNDVANDSKIFLRTQAIKSGQTQERKFRNIK